MVKEGFKQTEIGLIPEDWEVMHFFDLFKFKSTASYSRAELSSNDEYGYIHYGDIHTKFNFHLDINNYVSGYISKDQLKTYSFIEEGDLIMADASEDYSGIGKAFEVIKRPQLKAISGLHTFLIRPIERTRFAKKFIGYFHENPLIKKQYDSLATGLKVFSLSKGVFNFIQIPLPPLPEQKAIAEALSDTDSWIENLEQCIAKKRLIKQGAMQDLLTPKESWEVKKLGEVFKLKQGVQCGVDKQFYNQKDGLIRFIRIVDVTQKEIEARFIIDPGAEHHIKKNDLFMVRYGAPGVVGFNYEGVIANNLFRLIEKFKINSKFFKHLFDYLKPKLEEISSSSTLAALNFTSLNSLKLSFPDVITEQTRIATILSDMDNEIESLENKLQKARQIKQGMMQELLTGRVRLV